MKKEMKHNLIIALVLVVAIVALFAYSSFKFTGMAILEGYNETSCAEAGYTWEILTEESCTAIEDCVLCVEGCVTGELCEEGCVEEYTEILCVEECQETCEEGDTECVLCEEGCVEEYTELLCEEGCVTGELCAEECQENCEICEDVVIGSQCTGDVCDADHLSLCLTQEGCEATEVGGFWYGEICNSEEECVAETCESLDYECGNYDNGCGGTLTCGTCDSGYTCGSGGICVEETVDDESSSSGDDTPATKAPVTTNTIKKSSCFSKWECEEWGECIEEIQTRTCVDTNNCIVSGEMPETSQACAMPETCFDEIKNQNEKGVDCGGICEKKCGVFTIIGSVVEGPVDFSKEFLSKNKFKILISLGILVVLAGGIVAMKVFLHKTPVDLWDIVLKKAKVIFNKRRAKKIGEVTKI